MFCYGEQSFNARWKKKKENKSCFIGMDFCTTINERIIWPKSKKCLNLLELFERQKIWRKKNENETHNR